MATDQLEALETVKQLQTQKLKEEYGGKASNLFVQEIKSAALFQCNWGELLSAAPTALSLMGSCWIAASQDKAEQIFLGDARPKDGFKYLTNRDKPTLRACLVDVCNNGGSRAFKIASANMDILRTRSQQIFGANGRIDVVFLRLPACTKSAAALEDFTDCLQDLSNDATYCADVSGKIREAFEQWGKMVGELHATVEQKYGNTSAEAENISMEEKVTLIEETFSSENKDAADKAVTQANDRVKANEKRLDRATENVPGPWQTVLMTAVNGYAQALPAIIAGALPVVMSTVNPGAAIGQVLGSALKGAAAPPAAHQGSNGAESAPSPTSSSMPRQTALDTACTAASELLPCLNAFYEFLGGDKGQIDWTKFTETSEQEPGKPKLPQGVAWLKGNLYGQKSKFEPTTSEASKRLAGAFEKAIDIAVKIQEAQTKKKDMNSEEVKEAVLNSWKNDVKEGRDSCLALSATTTLNGSVNAPNAFAKMDIKIPPADLSSQKAALSAAMQGVQIAQQSLDLAQEKYDLAIEKQGKMKAALLQVQTKLKSLQESGKTLESIKSVLRDCISVLVDLAAQIAKLERFFVMLKNLINELVLPKVRDFTSLMSKAGKRSFAAGRLAIDDITKQLVYTATLQIKAYFSLLYDIADMYCKIDRQYIVRGMELCGQLSKVAAAKSDTGPALAELTAYNEESTAAVDKLVDDTQKSMLADMKARAQRAQETTSLIEDASVKAGIEVDSLKNAITEGAEDNRKDAQRLLNSTTSATESIDLSDM